MPDRIWNDWQGRWLLGSGIRSAVEYYEVSQEASNLSKGTSLLSALTAL